MSQGTTLLLITLLLVLPSITFIILGRDRIKPYDRLIAPDEVRAEDKAVIRASAIGSSQEKRFFRAGIVTAAEKSQFRMIQLAVALGISAIIVYFLWDFDLIVKGAGIILAAYLGYLLPNMYLDRVIADRDEDIQYYLPLVIEQIVMGVSCGLDVGPCVQRVVSMANERHAHNPVTIFLRNVLSISRSGISFDEALEEVGKMSSHKGLEHSFMTLANVARHGGEITRQLQELGSAVTSAREVTIETRIKQLELKGTGPVAMVFFAFISVLFAGIGVQLTKAFSMF